MSQGFFWSPQNHAVSRAAHVILASPPPAGPDDGSYSRPY